MKAPSHRPISNVVEEHSQRHVFTCRHDDALSHAILPANAFRAAAPAHVVAGLGYVKNWSRRASRSHEDDASRLARVARDCRFSGP